jgi:hypothetical protein
MGGHGGAPKAMYAIMAGLIKCRCVRVIFLLVINEPHRLFPAWLAPKKLGCHFALVKWHPSKRLC